MVRVIKSRRLRWAGYVNRMERGRSALKVLIGKPTRKKPIGRTMYTWENNITTDLKEIGANTRNWIDLAQDRGYWQALVNMTLNICIP